MAKNILKRTNKIKKITLVNNIGLVVNPIRPNIIAEKIIEMTKKVNQTKYRQNLKGLAISKYNWKNESKKLIEFYDRVFMILNRNEKNV